MDSAAASDKVKECVARGIPYSSLPQQPKRSIAQKDYMQALLHHALANQWSYDRSGSWDVQRLLTPKEYYCKLMQFCRDYRLLYPYRFDTEVMRHTKTTPFHHYRTLLSDMLKSEKSYDTLPNFTAIDCLRLTGIGRNQYIHIMNGTKVKKGNFIQNLGRAVNAATSGGSALPLPEQIVPESELEPWWGLLVVADRLDKLYKDLLPAELALMEQVMSQAELGSAVLAAAGSFAAPSDAQQQQLSSTVKSADSAGATAPPSLSTSFGDATPLSEILPAAGGSTPPAPPAAPQAPAAVQTKASLVAAGRPFRYLLPMACLYDKAVVESLFHKGILYPSIGIEGSDHIVVPPLQNFVMNRASSDPFEKLLYDILVSIDSRTSVAELGSMLEKDSADISNAIAIYCRIGMAYKKNTSAVLKQILSDGAMHPSWKPTLSKYSRKTAARGNPASPGHPSPHGAQGEAGGAAGDAGDASASAGLDPNASCVTLAVTSGSLQDPYEKKRIGFVFDSELTAYLMMGNLGVLKQHAVTLFEAGKMTDELLGLLAEQLHGLDCSSTEGEVRKYFDHAVALREVLVHLRRNKRLMIPDCDGLLDLVRAESLNSLDPDTRIRILNKNYACVLSMSPLASPLCLSGPLRGHYGNAVSLMASPWFPLFTSAGIGCGPAVYVYTRGVCLRRLPASLSAPAVQTLLLYPWTLDSHPTVLHTSNALLRVNEELQCQPVMLVPYEMSGRDTEVLHVPFPPSKPEAGGGVGGAAEEECDAAQPEQEKRDGDDPPKAEGEPGDAADVPQEAGSGGGGGSVAKPLIPPQYAEEVERQLGRFVSCFGLECSIGHIKLVVDRPKKGGKGVGSQKAAAMLAARKNEYSRVLEGLWGSLDLDAARQDSDTLNATRTSTALSATLNSTLPTGDVRILPHGMFFGVPLFDPALTREVISRITSQQLFAPDNMDRHSAAMQRLTARFADFVDTHVTGGSPLMVPPKADKCPMHAKPQSTLPFPAHCLLFDGEKLHVRDPEDM